MENSSLWDSAEHIIFVGNFFIIFTETTKEKFENTKDNGQEKKKTRQNSTEN
jgi:hypothetical protein